MARLRVGILFGGQSVEHDVSVVSARSIAGAMDRAKYEPVPIAITRDGRWLSPAASAPLLEPGRSATAAASSPSTTRGSATGNGEHPAFAGAGGAAPGVPALAGGDPAGSPFGRLDVVFPVLHGTLGEDGSVQGLLELAGIPYVGGGVLASAAGMDKQVMKRLFRDAGIPLGRFLACRRGEWERDPAAVAAAVREQLGYPCFVKPANGGSSVGVVKVAAEEGLASAVEQAFRLDRKVVVEEAIAGRELECSVLGNDDPIASAVGEIIPAREFYDYEAKYHDDRTRLIVPADLPAATADRVRALAIKAFTALDCAGMARVDFFLRAADEAVLVNEINTIPGFTNVSMYPRMWQASGLPYPDLIDRLIQLALERHRDALQTRAYVAGHHPPTGAPD